MAFNNLHKKASKADAVEKTVAEQLASQTESQGTSIDGLKNTEKLIDGVRGNKDLIDTTEVQLDGTRTKLNEEDGIEKRLEASKQREGDVSPLVSPLAALNHAQEDERTKEWKKAQKSRDTDFWDKYTGTDVKGLIPKSRGKGGESQLPNHPDRFSKLTTDPKSVGNIKVKEMVTASLKDADAMLLHVFYTAAAERRDLTAKEKSVVAGINDAKIRLLTAQVGGPDHIAQRIEQLQQQLQNQSLNSPDHDRMRHELEALIEQARHHTNGGGTPTVIDPAMRNNVIA